MTTRPLNRAFARLASGFAARLASHVSALVLLIYGARHVTPEAFGAYTLASIVVALATLFLFAGVYEFILKSDRIDEEGGPALVLLVAIGVAAAGIMLAAAGLVASVYAAPDLERMLQVFAVVPLLGALTAWREASYLRDSRHLERYFGLTAVRDLLALAVGIVLLHAGFGVWALVGYRLAVAVAGYGLMTLASPGVPAPRWDVPAMRRIASFGGGVGATRLLGFASNNGIDLLIGLFLTPAAVGLYRIATRIITTVYDVITQPVVKSAWVRLAEAGRKGRDGLTELQSMQSLTLLVLACLLAFLAVGAPTLVPLVLGAHWAEAVPLVPWVCLAFMLRALVAFVDPLMSLRDEPGRLLQLRLVTTGILFASVAASAGYGVDAVVMARAAAAAVTALVLWAGVQRWSGIPVRWALHSVGVGLVGLALTAGVTRWIASWGTGAHATLLIQGAATAVIVAVSAAVFWRHLRRAVLPPR